VFHIGEKLTLKKDIHVEGACLGIDSFRDNLIVGFQSPTPRVEHISEEGAVLNTLASNTSGGQLFSEPRYIQVDNTTGTDRILVTDWDKETVYMLDVDLQLLQAFQLPTPGEPRGLAAVGGGQVMVTDWRTDTLQLLDLTTGQWRTLMGEMEGLDLTTDQWETRLGEREGLGQPWSLVYNQAVKDLYVGCCGDVVKVYTVSEGMPDVERSHDC